MRKFIDLIESVTADYATNEKIEAALQSFPEEDRVLMRDGLDIIQQAGDHGVSGQEWMAAMRSIHTDAGVRLPSGSMLKPAEAEWKPVDQEKRKAIFRAIQSTFPDLIRRDNAAQRYYWNAAPMAPTDDVDLNSPLAQAATCILMSCGVKGRSISRIRR